MYEVNVLTYVSTLLSYTYVSIIVNLRLCLYDCRDRGYFKDWK